MPTYDYKCPTCGVVKEIKVDLNEKTILLHCGYEKMEKQISKSGIHFKGSGFYETDYKQK